MTFKIYKGDARIGSYDTATSELQSVSNRLSSIVGTIRDEGFTILDRCADDGETIVDGTAHYDLGPETAGLLRMALENAGYRVEVE